MYSLALTGKTLFSIECQSSPKLIANGKDSPLTPYARIFFSEKMSSECPFQSSCANDNKFYQFSQMSITPFESWVDFIDLSVFETRHQEVTNKGEAYPIRFKSSSRKRKKRIDVLALSKFCTINRLSFLKGKNSFREIGIHRYPYHIFSYRRCFNAFNGMLKRNSLRGITAFLNGEIDSLGNFFIENLCRKVNHNSPFSHSSGYNSVRYLTNKTLGQVDRR